MNLNFIRINISDCNLDKIPIFFFFFAQIIEAQHGRNQEIITMKYDSIKTKKGTSIRFGSQRSYTY